MLWDIVVWIVFGLIAGAIARLLMPGRDPMGCLGTIALGVAGSFIGGFLASLIFGHAGEGFQPANLIGSVIGALILLFIFRKMAGPRRV